MDAQFGHARFVEHDTLIHQVHPVIHLHMQHRALHRQGQGVAPIEGVATGLTQRLTHHIACGARVGAVALIGQLPNAFFTAAVCVDKVFIQRAFVALPVALHVHREAFHDFAVAVGEDAPGIDHAVEVSFQIENRLFRRVVVHGGAGAAAQTRGADRAGNASGQKHSSIHHGKPRVVGTDLLDKKTKIGMATIHAKASGNPGNFSPSQDAAPSCAPA